MVYFALFIFLFQLSQVLCQTDLKQQCEAMNGTAGKTTFYYRGSCIVRRGAAGMPFDQAKTMCDDFDKTTYKGHLVHVLDDEMSTKIRDESGISIGNTDHIGLVQNDTSDEPAGYWYWIDEHGEPRWSASGHTTSVWRASEPDNNGECGTYGYFTPGMWKHLADFPCVISLPFICQYHDINVCFEMTLTDQRGMNNDLNTVAIFGGVYDMKMCSKKCIRNIMCQSFSHNKIIGECMLHYYTSKNLQLEANTGFNVYEKY